LVRSVCTKELRSLPSTMRKRSSILFLSKSPPTIGKQPTNLSRNTLRNTSSLKLSNLECNIRTTLHPSTTTLAQRLPLTSTSNSWLRKSQTWPFTKRVYNSIKSIWVSFLCPNWAKKRFSRLSRRWTSFQLAARKSRIWGQACMLKGMETRRTSLMKTMSWSELRMKSAPKPLQNSTSWFPSLKRTIGRSDQSTIQTKSKRSQRCLSSSQTSRLRQESSLVLFIGRQSSIQLTTCWTRCRHKSKRWRQGLQSSILSPNTSQTQAKSTSLKTNWRSSRSKGKEKVSAMKGSNHLRTASCSSTALGCLTWLEFWLKVLELRHLRHPLQDTCLERESTWRTASARAKTTRPATELSWCCFVKSL